MSGSAAALPERRQSRVRAKSSIGGSTVIAFRSTALDS